MNPTGLIRTSPFFATYYLADLMQQILDDMLEAAAVWSDTIAEIAEEAAKSGFTMDTALHQFIRAVTDRELYLFDSETFVSHNDNWLRFQLNHVPEDHCSTKLWAELALKRHGLPFDPFEGWLKDEVERDEDLVYDWYEDLRLSESYDKLIHAMADEVFHVLFANRRILFNFNEWIAWRIGNDDLGPVRRERPPSWAKRAVFFRDRGRCCQCGQDLSGLLSQVGIANLDHVVPLVANGINDVTNLQLLCDKHNAAKAGRIIVPSNSYEAWFHPDAL